MNRLRHLAATALIALSGTANAEPASPSHWVASWQASPQPVWGPDFLFPTLLPVQLENQTFRQTARLSLGGPRLRVRLSNAHGTQPLQIDAASVAVEAGSPPLALRFDGQPGVRIAPGQQRLSDPLALPTRNLQQLQVSTYLAGPPRCRPSTGKAGRPAGSRRATRARRARCTTPAPPRRARCWRGSTSKHRPARAAS